ncbi:MAG: hypothetical protein H6816_05265 [Phycisphaerales bacterium]|nr:hypothetical protein [Phycisphaerales bacterium]
MRMLPRARVAGAVAVMAAPAGTARFAAGKALAVTAERDPARVYPHFEAIAGLIDSASKVVRWNALQILGWLGPVDEAGRIAGVLDKYLGVIQEGNLISAANAIAGAGRIAVDQPELTERIVPALLGVERARYATAECRNVAIGHVLTALEGMWARVGDQRAVRVFVKRQVKNPRPAVARQAVRLVAAGFCRQ